MCCLFETEMGVERKWKGDGASGLIRKGRDVSIHHLFHHSLIHSIIYSIIH